MNLRQIIIILFVISATAFGKTKIKFATVAPDGSTWMKVMKEFSQAVEDSTEGRVEFRIYPGGVAGDEMVVLRKIRVGQLHSGGFTGVGLGEILPEVRILDAPHLFRSHAEVDYVTDELFDYFAQKFEEKGFILLGWAEVGFVYIFSNTAITSLDDMTGIKMWMWEGDPIAEATFASLDLSPIPLSLTDVLTSLQTNLVNGVYVSPLACVALQWHTRVKYMLDFPLANSNGAVLLSKKQFMKLSEEDQQILRKISRNYFSKLTQMSREDNKKSLELIREEGIQFSSIKDKSKIANFYEAGKKTRRKLIGKLYDEQFLNQVEGKIKEYREQVAAD
jgi:TRAP-type C4-dicarboxylate transport system substrate-binding protein